MVAKLRLVFSILLVCLFFPLGAQQGLSWTQTAQTSVSTVKSETRPARETTFRLDPQSLNRLVATPAFSKGAISVSLPMPDGNIRMLKLSPSQSMHPDLMEKYPAIRSFIAQDPQSGTGVRLSISFRDVQATYRTGEGELFFLQPEDRSAGDYRLYNISDPEGREPIECLTPETLAAVPMGLASRTPVTDRTRRTFRLAVAATGEYTQYHGGTVAGALSAMNATVTRINEVFNNDLGIQLQLIGTTDQVIYTDALTDPYDNNLNSELQNDLNANIGVANYDVGHLFHRDNDNGNAGFIGGVCRDNQKGSAFSSAQTPEGDTFDIDLVAHELGHQFGANHTYSFASEGTGVQAEPASGSTIMAYAGFAAGDNNIQFTSDDYFHYYSIVQIRNFLQTVSCGTTEAIANNPPALDALTSYTVPSGTPFFLEASATDPDGDALTYCWEQIDNGRVTSSTFGPTRNTGANFRSLSPTTGGVRYFPRLDRVRTGELTLINPTTGDAWETVSLVGRSMNFAVTVRDNEISGGQVVAGTTAVDVIEGTGPFRFENLNSPGSWTAGDRIELQWDVAGTDAAPISASTVSVYASEDGGLSFPYLVRSGLDNTGSALIQVPAISTSSLRFMIRADDQIFFTVNLADQAVSVPDFAVELDELRVGACGEVTVSIPFTYTDYSGSPAAVDFELEPVSGLTLSINPVQTNSATQNGIIEITAQAGATAGTYPITFRASSGAYTQETILDFVLGQPIALGPEPQSPANGEVLQTADIPLSWQAIAGAVSYEAQVSTQPDFAADVTDYTTFNTAVTATGLTSNTDYYWRVRAISSCGTGPFSAVQQFRTPGINCFNYSSTSVPVTLPQTGTNLSTAQITVPNDLPVEDVRVRVTASHTWMSDLVIRLVSPQGTIVTLIDQLCEDADDIDAVFDDAGQQPVCSTNPAVGGTIRPTVPLSSFEGESALGIWTLEVDDQFDQDGGVLTAFELELCLVGQPPDDDDADGVPNDSDLCPDTPNGQDVDATGCPVFLLPSDAFTITINSESCRDNNDGSIVVSANDTNLIYTAVLIGDGGTEQLAFSQEAEFASLTAGAYELCISATDGSNAYQQVCYRTVVDEPPLLSVSALQSQDGNRLSLSLDGAAEYSIELNGVEVQTTQEQYQLDLRPGLNIVTVKGELACKGVYQQAFINGSAVYVAPNPVISSMQVFLPPSLDRFRMRVYGPSGTPVASREYTGVNGSIEWNASQLPPGIYILEVSSDGFRAITKFVKQ